MIHGSLTANPPWWGMAIRSRKRSSLSRFIAPVATLIILGYFGFHAFNGQYGIRANIAMQKRIDRLEQRLADRTAFRNKLESRVALLREGTLEKDMVDEHVRKQLNMMREDEVVLFR